MTLPSPPPRPEAAAAPKPGDGLAAALGRIPSGLFVITWREGDSDRAMLASWVMQAGFVPPAVSLAVAATRDLLAAIDRGVPLVVNLLTESQRPLLARFGKPAAPGDDPFAGLAVLRTASGTAALQASGGWLECRALSRATAGDHVVVVAEVVGGDCASSEEPLVHVRKNGLRY